MAKLQKEFRVLHDAIKLGTYDENATLRQKRDLLIDELRDKLKDEKIPGTDKSLTFTKYDQGSYAMNTGVKPKNDDFDIDVGIIFDITNDDYDSHKLKQLIFDKLDTQHNRTVEYNRPCITVKYSDGYHVDLAIYSDNDDDIHIAWGKKNSKERLWFKAEPKELTDWVADVSDECEESKQFRCNVRYLKKWKWRKFSSYGNAMPPSIGITIQARDSFIYKKDDDLAALVHIVESMINEFDDRWCKDSLEFKKCIVTKLPVAPYKDVYYKMSLKQTDEFYRKLETLLEALEAARDEASDYKASKILIKIFGDDFPEAEDVRKSYIVPAVHAGDNA
ncbi:cyclic GMP-AMP synthase DncV-like nucleotidyltransferase [Cycloclasticus pugetii]|uniref:cyclic GMP-AMP synthase DncV-like nucleotidyltransferase n=1 Tax=Cycloclasticus pugetii TaxID=34068 RepID=UPI00093492BB|nr:nucleotidyltransferase [Cycloclasticus pugetii]MDF1829590.1 hypothetical protein [Cycloclasticus pugetii]